MATARVWVLGALGASLMAAAAAMLLLLLLPADEGPPPLLSKTAAGVVEPPVGAAEAEAPSQRTLAPSVRGKVLDPTGNPVAGIRVAMTGTDTFAESTDDGSFTFCTLDRGTCRVLPQPGWLAIESPLLDLCTCAHAPTLIVARSARPQGRVVDPDGAPIAHARVAVTLHANLPPEPRWPKARSVRMRGDWSGETNADGWYQLPPSPVGDRAQLLVELEGYSAACVDLDASPGLVHVTLRPAAAIADPLPTDLVETPDAGIGIDGWLLDEAGRPRSGWWAAAVVDADAAPGSGPWGRFAQPPVRVADDGRVAFPGLRHGSYRIEAWQAQNHAVLRSQPVAAPASHLRLCVEDAVLPRRIHGRVIDASGAPIGRAKAGLARPTGWAVPGHLAMHQPSIVTTDRDGNFAIETHGLAALELVIAGEPVVPQRLALAGGGDERRIEVRATRRQWLELPAASPTQTPTTAPTLTALDARGRSLPIWLDDSPLLHPSCSLASASAFGFPADSHSLVLRRGDREVARLYLRP